MTRVAYFDCFAGASGDMILGALLDAGLPIEALRAELSKLGLSHFGLEVEQTQRSGLHGSRAIVTIDQDHHGQHDRHLSTVTGLIDRSDLDDSIKTRSIAVFHRLAEAEAAVHSSEIEEVHFHEVGAMDAIVDVVGAVAGISLLEVEQVRCSPLHLGSGTVKCAHGTLPVPAPATAELVKGVPVYSTGIDGELLTPTGAALLTTLTEVFGHMPAMVVDKIGYGAGTAERSIPNLLRVVIGDAPTDGSGAIREQVAVLETNIDDMNPQLYEYIVQQSLAMGALDTYVTPVHMKKGRPGAVLTLICAPSSVDEFVSFLMRETTTIGLRWRIDNRLKADRRIDTIETPLGEVAVKVALLGGEVVNVAPEYEDCKRVALATGIPLKRVMETVRAQAAVIYSS